MLSDHSAALAQSKVPEEKGRTINLSSNRRKTRWAKLISLGTTWRLYWTRCYHRRLYEGDLDILEQETCNPIEAAAP